MICLIGIVDKVTELIFRGENGNGGIVNDIIFRCIDYSYSIKVSLIHLKIIIRVNIVDVNFSMRSILY